MQCNLHFLKVYIICTPLDVKSRGVFLEIYSLNESIDLFLINSIVYWFLILTRLSV